MDNPREMVSYVFGTGSNKFWCFEHNLIDYPMDQFKTVNDIVVKLDDNQSELMDSDDFTYTPDHEIFNLWCCTSEPFENIIISSLKFMVSMQCHSIGYEWIKELCDQKDTRPDEIVIDEHGQWVNTAYFDDDINEKVYKKMLFAQNEINVRRTQQIVDSIIEQYPNTIFKNISVDDDITTYIVVDSNDSKNITLDDFFNSINRMNVIMVDCDINDSIMVDGVDISCMNEKLWYDEFTAMYNDIYAKIKNDIDNGVHEIERPGMKVFFKE